LVAQIKIKNSVPDSMQNMPYIGKKIIQKSADRLNRKIKI